jgi:RimJ/RimL family protein N-acetyltransferase
LPIPIETENLFLRRPRERDWKDLFDYLSDAELLKYDGMPPAENEDAVIEWLRTYPRWNLMERGQYVCLCVVFKPEGKVIGDLDVRLEDDDHLLASFNIRLNRNYHGRGFATEACTAALEFCFRGIGVRRVIAYCDTRNSAGCRLLARIGMRKEGEFLKECLVKGQWITRVLFAMLTEEYEGRQEASDQLAPRPAALPLPDSDRFRVR